MTRIYCLDAPPDRASVKELEAWSDDSIKVLDALRDYVLNKPVDDTPIRVVVREPAAETEHQKNMIVAKLMHLIHHYVASVPCPIQTEEDAMALMVSRMLFTMLDFEIEVVNGIG